MMEHLSILPLLANVSPLSARLMWLGWLVAAVHAVCLIPMVRFALAPRRASSARTNAPSITSVTSTCPAVLIVVPACNEGLQIRAALQSMLQLDYPRFHIVAVDDRSTDDTGPIMDELAAGDPRLSVLHIQDLPTGFLGKNHANWQGASVADSDWILFTDGDIVFQPQALEWAMAYVTQHGLDHLAAFPRMRCHGFMEALMVTTFSMLFSARYPPWLVRSRWVRFHVGVGAFNLIRRQAYARLGTHQRLAMEVADDLKLGKLVKMHGFRQDVVDGRELCDVRWQMGAWGVVRGLEKNGFAGFDFSMPRAIRDSIFYAIVLLSPYGFAVTLPWPESSGYLAALAQIHAVFALLAWTQGFSVFLTLGLPLSLALMLYTIWRSIGLALWRGGIIWRGTFYPLSDIRRGVV